MKKMSTKQKIAHNRVTAKRRKRFLKRREHVAILRAAERRINMIHKKMAKMQYYQQKYRSVQPQGKVL